MEQRAHKEIEEYYNEKNSYRHRFNSRFKRRGILKYGIHIVPLTIQIDEEIIYRWCRYTT